MKNDTFGHRPVLLDECIEALRIRPGGIYVDGTLGRGGHAREILRRLGGGRLICIDRDEEALLAANEAFQNDLDKVILIRSNFREIESILSERNIAGVDGMLFDLGVSSPQLDDFGRGFSYMHDAPLDMRMDPSLRVTAAEILNTWSEQALADLFGIYGEERYSRRIARAIVMRRRTVPFERTAELVETIKRAIPTPARFGAGNPARRVFQALRIEVNDELNSLRRALPEAFALLEPGKVLAVISFHSLEDRIVKEFFAGKARGCTCPPDFPVCVCGGKVEGDVLTRKAIIPGARELENNPRSSSAKLRALRKA